MLSMTWVLMRMASSCGLTEIRFIQWLDVRRCVKDSEFIALLSLGLILVPL